MTVTEARARRRPLSPFRRATPDELRESWREALDAADSALHSATGFLPDDELREQAKRLSSERESTAVLLRSYAWNESGTVPAHLVLVPREAERLLGLTRRVRACIFNLDGVLIGSAAIHAEAWARTFDAFLLRRTERTGGTFAPFDPRVDYPAHMHGKPRLDGVRGFLSSRGISLAEGSPEDAPGAETVHGLANQKKALFVSLLEQRGVTAFEGAHEYLETARDAHVRCAVVSASANVRMTLELAALADLVDAQIDGKTIVDERLEPRPAPDILTAAARRLEVEPREAAVFETTPAGIEAGRRGGFGVVVGVGRGDRAQALRDAGADIVVTGLEELFERRQAA